MRGEGIERGERKREKEGGGGMAGRWGRIEKGAGGRRGGGGRKKGASVKRVGRGELEGRKKGRKCGVACNVESGVGRGNGEMRRGGRRTIGVERERGRGKGGRVE